MTLKSLKKLVQGIKHYEKKKLWNLSLIDHIPQLVIYY